MTLQLTIYQSEHEFHNDGRAIIGLLQCKNNKSIENITPQKKDGGQNGGSLIIKGFDLAIVQGVG